MTTKKTKNPTGLMGDHVHIDLTNPVDFDLYEIKELLERNTPLYRIDQLKDIPGIKERAERLEAEIKNQNGQANPIQLASISGLETTALYLKAAPVVIRDNKRQEGTKKERRPNINAWINKQMKRTPKATRPELWDMAPDWLTDEIGRDRFLKRVSKVRKKNGMGRK